MIKNIRRWLKVRELRVIQRELNEIQATIGFLEQREQDLFDRYKDLCFSDVCLDIVHYSED